MLFVNSTVAPALLNEQASNFDLVNKLSGGGKTEQIIAERFSEFSQDTCPQQKGLQRIRKFIEDLLREVAKKPPFVGDPIVVGNIACYMALSDKHYGSSPPTGVVSNQIGFGKIDWPFP